MRLCRDGSTKQTSQQNWSTAKRLTTLSKLDRDAYRPTVERHNSGDF
jgi:hypothetical protein